MVETFNRVKEKLTEFSDKEQHSESVIIQKGNNFYVYGLYRIEKFNNLYKIYYTDINEYATTVFTSKSAISWCNAMKACDVELADKIERTDKKLEYLSNDIFLAKHRLKSKNISRKIKAVLVARLTDYIIEQCQLKLNLHKYIQISNEIKNKGFSNEFTTVTDTKNLTRVR